MVGKTGQEEIAIGAWKLFIEMSSVQFFSGNCENIHVKIILLTILFILVTDLYDDGDVFTDAHEEKISCKMHWVQELTKGSHSKLIGLE